jgi:hypothetical protein
MITYLTSDIYLHTYKYMYLIYTQDGNTSLHLAAAEGDVAQVINLCQADQDAKLNSQNNVGLSCVPGLSCAGSFLRYAYSTCACGCDVSRSL